MSRPELYGPATVVYNKEAAAKYTDASRNVEIQAKLTARAIELLALPKDGKRKFLLDVGCGSGLSGEHITEEGHTWVGTDISEVRAPGKAEALPVPLTLSPSACAAPPRPR